MVRASLEWVKRGIVAPRPWWVNAAILVAALTGATVLRLVIDRGQNGFPFLTFFPVILLGAVFLGSRYALVAAVITPVLVSRLLLPSPWFDGFQPQRIVILAFYASTIAFVILTGHILRVLVRESEAHSAQQQAFNAELQHRTKNSLQIMRALIARGPRGEDPSTYFRSLAGRLDALAKANELLRFGALESAPLRELVHSAISPFDGSRFLLDGPDCRVSRQAATPLMMALHELCTNAIKYGSLSAERGTVEIRWIVPQPGSPNCIGLVWRERGGPQVSPPTHRGLGSRLLRANGGLVSVRLDWQSDGLVCRMAALDALHKPALARS